MPGFLKAVDEKRVQKVELLEGGNVAFAYISSSSSSSSPTEEGKKEEGGGGVERLRIGEGFPVEDGKSWSSPLFVVRVLKDRGIPYTLGFDLTGAKMTSSVPSFLK